MDAERKPEPRCICEMECALHGARHALAPSAEGADEREAIARELECVVSPLATRQEMESDIQRLAARVRALAAPQATGWVTVTDDPVTWPPDTGRNVLLVCWGNVGGEYESMQRGSMARFNISVGALCVRRWMPWPSAAPAAGKPTGGAT